MTSHGANRQLTTYLKRVMRDAQDLLKATARKVGEKVKESRSRLAAALDSTKATSEQLQGRTVHAARETHHLIREYPYESIGTAFGLGLLVGVLRGDTVERVNEEQTKRRDFLGRLEGGPNWLTPSATGQGLWRVAGCGGARHSAGGWMQLVFPAGALLPAGIHRHHPGCGILCMGDRNDATADSDVASRIHAISRDEREHKPCSVSACRCRAKTKDNYGQESQCKEREIKNSEREKSGLLLLGSRCP